MKKDNVLGIIGIILSLLVSAWLLVYVFNNYYVILAAYWLQLFVIFYIHKLKNIKWYSACVSVLMVVNIINIVGIIIWIKLTFYIDTFANAFAMGLAVVFALYPAIISAIVIIIECLISIGIRVYKYKKNNHIEKELS